MLISIIVAMDEARVIGKDGRLPWHIPEDLKRFKKITLGKPVIMGRKTFDSIGKPLPGRQNIVITRSAAFQAPGCTVVRSPEDALAAAGAASEVMVIGGADIFAWFLLRADRLHLTRVRGVHDGDVFFPALDSQGWREIPTEDSASAPPTCEFVTLARVP